MYYIGVTILLLVIVQLMVFGYEQVSRVRRKSYIFKLEKVLLKKRIDNIVTQNSKSNDFEWAWSGWRKFRINSIISENSQIKSFYLVPHDGKKLPQFLPGQYLTFRLKIPGLSKPVVRCYSLSDSGEQRAHYRVSIREQLAPESIPKAIDGVASCYFHQTLEEGDILDVKAPTGKFWLDMTEKAPIVLVAGGVGITPMLSMINTLDQYGGKREVWLFYGVQNVEQLIMTDHLKQMSIKHDDFHLHHFFSVPGALGVRASGTENHGHISCESIFQLGAPLAADFYICGPGAMMDSMVLGLQKQGVSEARIHFESFGPAGINRGVAKTEVLPEKPETTIPVTFGLSDKTILWSAASGTLLEAAEAAGIQIESGCRAGSCGTCLTAVIEGEVSYIEDPDSDVEKGSCLTCIAVPKSKLRLDA